MLRSHPARGVLIHQMAENDRSFEISARFTMERLVAKLEEEWNTYIETKKGEVRKTLNAMFPAFKRHFLVMAKETLDSLPHLKGEPGRTPKKGVDYFDGKPGDPGYTPQADVDYPSIESMSRMISASLETAVRQIEKKIPKDLMSRRDVMKFVGKMMLSRTSPAAIARGIEKLERKEKLDYHKGLKNQPGFDVGAHQQRTLHRGGASQVYEYDLSDQCNGVLRSFTIPTNIRIVAVLCTDAPGGFFRKNTDYTGSGTTTLVLSSSVAAPLSGATLSILYVV